ncbi:hypothetical protein RF11_06599 [Thelohanellus kitauei]|uniref:Uncharacterized protein n=1 Tax=Thelohanellus kitauei TaxID=669202 RepID=A0A0C2MCB0_THEKT|nr:hypothetical protein RF11_06599 [Thelohanellus kitauei]
MHDIRGLYTAICECAYRYIYYELISDANLDNDDGAKGDDLMIDFDNAAMTNNLYRVIIEAIIQKNHEVEGPFFRKIPIAVFEGKALYNISGMDLVDAEAI